MRVRKSEILLGRLPFKTDLHLARKLWHMSMGLVIAFFYFSGIVPSRIYAIFVLSFFLLLNLLIEFFRLRNLQFNFYVMQVFRYIMRSDETSRLSGIPYYLLASIFAIWVFPKDVAVLSILFLACGDPAASLVGVLFGHRSIRIRSNRTLIGTLAGTATCIVIGFVYLRGIQIPEPYIPLLAVWGGLAGGTAELIPGEINDNLTIPLVSGFSLWLGFLFLGI